MIFTFLVFFLKYQMERSLWAVSGLFISGSDPVNLNPDPQPWLQQVRLRNFQAFSTFFMVNRGNFWKPCQRSKRTARICKKKKTELRIRIQKINQCFYLKRCAATCYFLVSLNVYR